MTIWVYACECADVEEEDLIRWDYGPRTFAIYHLVHGFYCTDGMCTHEAEHLEMGFVIDGVIECPLHQGRFDIATGKALSPPVCIDLITYPVKIEDGKVYVEI